MLLSLNTPDAAEVLHVRFGDPSGRVLFASFARRSRDSDEKTASAAPRLPMAARRADRSAAAAAVSAAGGGGHMAVRPRARERVHSALLSGGTVSAGADRLRAVRAAAVALPPGRRGLRGLDGAGGADRGAGGGGLFALCPGLRPTPWWTCRCIRSSSPPRRS